jgi:hypothetical protein
MALIYQLFAFAGVIGMAISPRIGLAVLRVVILMYGFGLGVA